MKRILIYDDEEAFRGNLRERVESLPSVRENFEIETPSNDEFRTWMEVLGNRQREFRQTGTWEGERIPLDETSIFIVDYDLFDTIPFLTAENVAYLVRCFSTCGLIVGVNQYGHNFFDLTLKGHPESFADVNIGQAQLDNPNLWGEKAQGFHPWHWPMLLDHLDAFDKKIEDVRESLSDDTPLYEVLGFPVTLFEALPRSIGQFLGEKPAEVNFREFVTDSENGLRVKDRESDHVSDSVVARVGAARISKWLERLVLSEQDILVDAPHLVSRYPSLINGDVEDIEAWNQTTYLVGYEDVGLAGEIIERFRSKREHWLSRPVWFWDELRECEDIAEVREPWSIARSDWVFCEDASAFYEERNCREFVADVESPFARRFVKFFDNVKYRPAVRFSLGIS